MSDSDERRINIIQGEYRVSADGTGLMPLTHSSTAIADNLAPQVSR